MTGTQEIAAPNEKRGWLGASLAIAPALAFAVLLIFPGFLAALFSRAGCDVYLTGGSWTYQDPYSADLSWWIGPEPILKRLRHMRATEIVLYPAATLMEHSSALRQFYTWQYQHAGGKVITGPIIVL